MIDRYFLKVMLWTQCEKYQNCAHSVIFKAIFSQWSYFFTIKQYSQDDIMFTAPFKITRRFFVILSQLGYCLTITLWAQFRLFSNCTHNVIVSKKHYIFRYFQTITLWVQARSATENDTISVKPNSILSLSFSCSGWIPSTPLCFVCS